MIQHVFLCNICESTIHSRPHYGADCLTLYRKGPCGAESSVLDIDEADKEHNFDFTRYPDPTAGIHICPTCAKALRAFFNERKQPCPANPVSSTI